MNPRLWKEAFFFEKMGYNVVIVTMWQSSELLQRDMKILEGHSIVYKNFLNAVPGEIKTFVHLFYRIRKRLAGKLQKFCKIGTKWAISYAPQLMIKTALKENAYLYSAHLECAFYAGRVLIKKGKKVSFDFEDWYSRDYLVPERPVKLLKSLEQFALRNGLFCTAASNAMATALKEAYYIKQEILVIYNGFPANEPTDASIPNKPEVSDFVRILWFSRTIGRGRGLENFLKALATYQSSVEFHILGEMKIGYKEFLDKTFALLPLHKICIHDFMPHAELANFISQFDIGLAIEEDINDNKILTVSNKILQYLQSGIPVIASDTKGQKEVAGFFPSLVKIVNINDPVQINEAIKMLSMQRSRNDEGFQQVFKSIFSWEAQEDKLKKMIATV